MENWSDFEKSARVNLHDLHLHRNGNAASDIDVTMLKTVLIENVPYIIDNCTFYNTNDKEQGTMNQDAEKRRWTK